MLRLAVIVLLLANAGYYAWSHGWLRSWGLAPVEQTEPQRMAQQIRPETLRILRARETPALPQGSWSPESPPIPGRWMVYMGRFADDEALDKKRAELRARKVPFDRPNNPTLEPGLSLGRFSSEEAAQRALTTLGNQGVRTARVVVERAEAPGFTLRLPALDSATRAQVETQLRPALGEKRLRTCP